MNGKSLVSVRNTPSNSSKRGWRIILFLGYILAIAVFRAGGAVPAHAAPPAQGPVEPYFEILLPPEPICAKQTYSVRVNVWRARSTIPGGKEVKGSKEPIIGVTVEGTSTNSSVGTIAPRYAYFGWDVDGPPGSAVFQFNALSPGTTNIYFEGIAAGFYVSSKFIPLQVKACRYLVTMDMQWRASIGISIGELRTQLAPVNEQSDQFKGSGRFRMVNFVRESPPCTGSLTGYVSPTTITGEIVEKTPGKKQLKLNFDFQPGRVTATVFCPEQGGSRAQGGFDPKNIGFRTATFPAQGGVKKFRLPNPLTPVPLTVTVKLIPAK